MNLLCLALVIHIDLELYHHVSSIIVHLHMGNTRSLCAKVCAVQFSYSQQFICLGIESMDAPGVRFPNDILGTLSTICGLTVLKVWCIPCTKSIQVCIDLVTC